MGQVSNLRFPKVFLLNPATELITGAAVKPQDLTFGQVGIFNAKTGLGAGAAPSNIAVPVIEIHQNLGDNKYGTTRTKPISVQTVRSWYAVQDSAPVDQILYIGYDEVVGTKTLTAYVGQIVEIAVTVYDNELTQWFGKAGYTERLVMDSAMCAVCVADCALIDPDSIADFFVARINGTDAPVGAFPTRIELTNWVTASKVATGTIGAADRRVGIKLVVKPHTPQLLEPCNPKAFYKTQLTTITAGVPYNCPNFPITTTVKAKSGNGFPMAAADLEKESQGYDRVRDQFEHPEYMKTNFVIRAVDGVKYDFYYLEFMYTHRDSGQPKEITDPYVVVFICPAGTGAPIEAFFTAWAVPLGFTAVTIAASTVKGNAFPQINA